MAESRRHPDPLFLTEFASVFGGVVRDGDTAIGIARVVIRSFHGEATVQAQEPFVAEDAGSYFWVIGAIPVQPLSLPLTAPFWVAIRKSDGAVLEIVQRVAAGLLPRGIR